MRDLILPAGSDELKTLRTGEQLLLTGILAAARDAAHKLMVEMGTIPFDIKKVPVFYTGPTPAPPDRPCGSCGPTTSSRMEPFIPWMLQKGMTIAIGKGDMSMETRTLFLEHGAVYLAAVGGSGAFSATRISSREVIAWEHLGPEAVSILYVEKLPVFVAWDLYGGNIYNTHGRDS